MKKIAIMQPYFFPYIGYFQLINAVDVFMFYDDVNFIKNGWINRNNILINNKKTLITVPCIKSSSFKKINEIKIDIDNKHIKKLYKSIVQSYSKAPYYDDVKPVIDEVFNHKSKTISDFAIKSVKTTAEYLKLNTTFKISSVDSPNSIELDRSDRLIHICKTLAGNHYINVLGGKKLYDKVYFENNSIKLNFIDSMPIYYTQFNEDFVPNLSIIDAMMFNSVEEINEMLDKYTLE